MKNYPVLLFAVFLFSCGGNGNKDSQLKTLNDQSLKCISVMNTAQNQKDAAMAAGNAGLATTYQATVDSAATENAKIGQQMMALQGEK